MRPWLLVSGDFVRTGGMDAANLALARYLAQLGREVHVVAHRIDPELALDVHFERVPKPMGSYLLGAPLLQRAAREHALRIPGAVRLANGGNYLEGNVNWVHYVHAAHATSVAGPAWRRAVSAGSRRRFLAAERTAVRGAAVVIANSERTRRDAITLLGADPARVHTVYYGTDPSVFRPASAAERASARARLELATDDAVVAFVGALGDRRKGCDLLISAWDRLRRAGGWDARLIVAGAGQELGAWRARVAALGLSEHVRLLGFRDDVRSLLWAADLLAAPSRYEAYGLAAHEALCCGVPVLTARAAGVAEQIAPPLDRLLLDDVEDHAALDARLRAWRSDPALFRSAAASTGTRLRMRAWDDMAAQIDAIVSSEIGA